MQVLDELPQARGASPAAIAARDFGDEARDDLAVLVPEDRGLLRPATGGAPRPFDVLHGPFLGEGSVRPGVLGVPSMPDNATPRERHPRRNGAAVEVRRRHRRSGTACPGRPIRTDHVAGAAEHAPARGEESWCGQEDSNLHGFPH